MTTLMAGVEKREVPWTALRLMAGAVLLVTGLLILLGAWRSGEYFTVGLGVMLTAVGLALGLESTAEPVAMSVGAILLAFIPFGLFVTVAGSNPIKVVSLMYEGAFGSWFSFQNTLTRAAPLMLTGLCTAIPMRVGLVIIGGEGALVIGALFAAGTGHLFQGSPPFVIISMMLLAGFLAGGLWIMLAGALKHYRGVNATISSLLLTYIAIALMNHMVEGPWRDPASLNKPSTWPIGDENMLGLISEGNFEVHWGLVIGVVACILCWMLMSLSTFGFAAGVVGGNVRAARVAGLPLGRILLTCCLVGGGAAGLAGAVEVSAVQGTCNATVVAGYGYSGILVAFLARQNPLAVIPVSVLLGGVAASGGLLQRRLGLPDATVNVLQGVVFLFLLAAETYYGRFKLLTPKEAAHG